MSEWQPIETAPRDGRVIIAYNGEFSTLKWWDGEPFEAESLWIYAEDILSDVAPIPDQPTHWMPIPPAP